MIHIDEVDVGSSSSNTNSLFLTVMMTEYIHWITIFRFIVLSNAPFFSNDNIQYNEFLNKIKAVFRFIFFRQIKKPKIMTRKSVPFDKKVKTHQNSPRKRDNKVLLYDFFRN